MIEFKVDSKTPMVEVIRKSGKITQILLPENQSWIEIKTHLEPHLDDNELMLAENLWCNDDFPRIFSTGEGFVTITPVTSDRFLTSSSTISSDPSFSNHIK